MMGHRHTTYLPAAGHDWALPFYDTITRIFGIDGARRKLLQQATIGPQDRILDVGCGTGTFAVLIKTQHPGVELAGLDPDPKALARARRKAERAGISAVFDEGFSRELPYADASFDHVFSSLMFHHVPADEKIETLREIRRVLKPGRSLHLLDFGGPDASGLRGWFLKTNKHTRDNFGPAIPTLMKQAGFEEATLVSHGMVLAGPIAYYRAT